MQFLYPTFLWALGALAIPVIIHLFHFRRFKKVYFTNVHLLKELKEETSTRSRLKSLLILLARCAALALLIFAFAQPVMNLGSEVDERDHAVEIFIDNSWSMEARDTEVPLITLAKDRAREIVSSYEESDRYLIITHDLATKHQRYVDQKTALEFIDDIKISPAVEQIQDISQVIERIRDRLSDHRHQLYILSDFQENISQFDTPIDTSVNVYLLPFRAVQESNVAITSARWEVPVPMKDQRNGLIVELENFGSQSQAVELRLDLEGQERPLGSLSISPNSKITDTVNISIQETGWIQMKVSIDDYPVEFDNELYLTTYIRDQVDVMNIYESGRNININAAFESFPYSRLSQVAKSGIKYELLKDQELIILDDLTNISSGLVSELTKYVQGGGNLLVFPSINANLNSYNTLSSNLRIDRLGSIEQKDRETSRLNTQAFVFSDIYIGSNRNLRLPATKANYPLQTNQSQSRERLLTYRDGSPYLTKYTLDRGNIFLSSAPLNVQVNNLVRQAEIFVPMLYKMAMSQGSKQPLSYTIGEDDIITLPSLASASGERYTMKGPAEFIPGVTSSSQTGYLDVRGQISQSGFYDLWLQESQIDGLAFNYDRRESDVTYSDIEGIAQSISPRADIIDKVALADLGGFISEEQDGVRLWRWCLILALLFLLIEIGLIRLMK